MIQTVLNEDHEIIVEVLKTIRQSMRKADKLAECSHFPLNGEMYLTDRDVAARLHISKRTLQEYRSSGMIPYRLLKRKPYYKRSDVEDFIRTYAKEIKKENDGNRKARIYV